MSKRSRTARTAWFAAIVVATGQSVRGLLAVPMIASTGAAIIALVAAAQIIKISSAGPRSVPAGAPVTPQPEAAANTAD